MENLQNDNLNLIREEIDLGERNSAFKGKTIRIKKLVKKENGSFTMKEETLDLGESISNSGIKILGNDNNNNHFSLLKKKEISHNFQKKPITVESIGTFNEKITDAIDSKITIEKPISNKKKNKMYYSTYSKKNNLKKINSISNSNQLKNLGNENVKNNMIVNNRNQNNLLMKDSIFCNENYLNNKMNTENLSNSIKSVNNMFKSQMFSMNQNINNQLFRLPKEIENFMSNLNNFFINYNKIKTEEEIKALERVKYIKNKVLNNFNLLEEKIKNAFKSHENNLNDEVNLLKNKIKNYKFFKNSKFLQDEDTIITIEELDYYDNKNDKKLKNEKYEMNIKAKDYELFINRRSLVYYKELIEKKILHMPEFGIGDCSDMIINDFIRKTNDFFNEEINELYPLIDEPENIDIKQIIVKPSIKLNNKIGFTGFGQDRNFEINKILSIKENWKLGCFEKLGKKHLEIDQKIPNICLFNENKIRTFSSDILKFDFEILSSLTIKVIKDIKKENYFFGKNFYEKLNNYDYLHLISSKNGLLGIYVEEYGNLKLFKNIIKINKNILSYKLYYDNYNLFILLDDNSINVFNLNSLKFTLKEGIINENIKGFEFFNKNQIIIYCSNKLIFYDFNLNNQNIFDLNYKKSINLNLKKIFTYNNFYLGLNHENLFYFGEENNGKSIIKNLNLEEKEIIDFLLIPNILGTNYDFMILIINKKGDLLLYDNIIKKIIKLELKENLIPFENLKIELIQLKEKHLNILINSFERINYYNFNIN